MSQDAIQIAALPQTLDEFIAVRDQIAHTPQGGAATMVIALLLHARDQELGRQALTVAVDRSRLQEGTDGYKGWQLRRGDRQRIDQQLRQQEYLPRSYIQGTSPEQGYTLAKPPYTITFQSNLYSGDPDSGTYKTFVHCSGAASPRPVSLKRNNRGVWKASEWSSLIMGIAPASRSTDDDL
jgi:hypothetical protein